MCERGSGGGGGGRTEDGGRSSGGRLIGHAAEPGRRVRGAWAQGRGSAVRPAATCPRVHDGSALTVEEVVRVERGGEGFYGEAALGEPLDHALVDQLVEVHGGLERAERVEAVDERWGGHVIRRSVEHRHRSQTNLVVDCATRARRMVLGWVATWRRPHHRVVDPPRYQRRQLRPHGQGGGRHEGGRHRERLRGAAQSRDARRCTPVPNE